MPIISPNTQGVHSYECVQPFQGEREGKPCGKTFILAIGLKSFQERSTVWEAN